MWCDEYGDRRRTKAYNYATHTHTHTKVYTESSNNNNKKNRHTKRILTTSFISNRSCFSHLKLVVVISRLQHQTFPLTTLFAFNLKTHNSFFPLFPYVFSSRTFVYLALCIFRANTNTNNNVYIYLAFVTGADSNGLKTFLIADIVLAKWKLSAALCLHSKSWCHSVCAHFQQQCFAPLDWYFYYCCGHWC